FELARKFRLRVARMSSVSSEVEYQGGGVAEIDPDLEDLDLSNAPPSAMGVARHRDSIDEFDPDELIHGDMAHGSPAPSRPPRRPDDYAFAGETPATSHPTRRVPAEAMHGLAARGMADYENRPQAGGWDAQNYGPTTSDGANPYGASVEDAVAR